MIGHVDVGSMQPRKGWGLGDWKHRCEGSVRAPDREASECVKGRNVSGAAGHCAIGGPRVIGGKHSDKESLGGADKHIVKGMKLQPA